MADVKLEFQDKEIRRLLKKAGEKPRWLKALAVSAQTVAFKEIIKNFQSEQGESGRWPRRKASTQKTYAIINKPINRFGNKKKPLKSGLQRAIFNPGNRLLQLSGRLRQGFRIENIEKRIDGVLMFNNVPYASVHDQGFPRFNIPQRQFMFISRQGMELLGRSFIFLLRKDIGAI